MIGTCDEDKNVMGDKLVYGTYLNDLYHDHLCVSCVAILGSFENANERAI